MAQNVRDKSEGLVSSPGPSSDDVNNAMNDCVQQTDSMYFVLELSIAMFFDSCPRFTRPLLIGVSSGVRNVRIKVVRDLNYIV